MCICLDQVGSTYYFRRVVPAELRPFIPTRSGKPRTEWKVSLGTKDRSEAKRLLSARTATCVTRQVAIHPGHVFFSPVSSPRSSPS